jgi:hypothetical protein
MSLSSALGFGIAGISHLLNDLNTKLQGQQKLVSDMFGDV